MVAQVAVSPVKMNIPAVTADRAVWARAYGRAVAEGLTATINESGLSWSVKGYTLIEYWSAGGSWRDVVCNCKAGQAAVPCKHAAMLIKTLSLGSRPLGRDVPVPAAVPVVTAVTVPAPVSPWAGLSVADLLARKGGDPNPPAPPAGEGAPPAAKPARARGAGRRPVAARGQTASPLALERARVARELKATKARASAAARAEEAAIAAQLDPDNDCDHYESFADFING